MMGSLPTEILSRIFENFETPISFEKWDPDWQHWEKWDKFPPCRELRALSLVSHLFHRVARPLIYRNVALRSRNGPNDSSADKFMHVLCAEPSLGHNIQALQIDPWVSDFGMEYFAHKLWGSPETLGWKREWMVNMWMRQEDHNVPLLALFVAPRLRTLDYMGTESLKAIAAYLSGRQDVEEDYFGTADEHGDSNDDVPDETGSETALEDMDVDGESNDVPAGRQESELFGPPSENPLPLLSEVRLGQRGAYDADLSLERACNIEGVLLHPGLTTLRLSAFRWTQYEVRDMNWKDVTSNITTLQLKDCLIDATGLANALQRCRLRHLHIVLAHHYGVDAIHGKLNLNEMGVALRRYGQSLESLDFDSTEFGDHSMTGRIGPLSGLSRLRSLKISLEDLGVLNEEDEEDEEDEEEVKVELRTCLPPTLESIHIHPSEKNGITRIPLTLLTDEVFTRLRTVEVEGYLVFKDEVKALEVPGWSKSGRDDMVINNKPRDVTGEITEEHVDYFYSVIFSRHAEVR